MQTLTEEKIDLSGLFLLEAPAGNVADLIRRNAERSIAQFGKFEKQTLIQLRQIYADAATRMEGIITLRGIKRRAGEAISMDETIRLGIMKREIEAEMRVVEGKLRTFAPDAVRKAGSMGEMAGASQMDILLKEIPRIGFPSFTLINREAIEFYANYTLTTTIDYGNEALGMIKRRLDLAMVNGEAWGPVARDVRKIMLEKRGAVALKGLNFKANRVTRTEMARAFSGGHTSYGRSCDFIIGEVQHVQAGACEVCSGMDGREYIFGKGESFQIVHPHGKCYTTYLFRKNLFTKDELLQLGV